MDIKEAYEKLSFEKFIKEYIVEKNYNKIYKPRYTIKWGDDEKEPTVGNISFLSLLFHKIFKRKTKNELMLLVKLIWAAEGEHLNIRDSLNNGLLHYCAILDDIKLINILIHKKITVFYNNTDQLPSDLSKNERIKNILTNYEKSSDSKVYKITSNSSLLEIQKIFRPQDFFTKQTKIQKLSFFPGTVYIHLRKIDLLKIDHFVYIEIFAKIDMTKMRIGVFKSIIFKRGLLFIPINIEHHIEKVTFSFKGIDGNSESEYLGYIDFIDHRFNQKTLKAYQNGRHLVSTQIRKEWSIFDYFICCNSPNETWKDAILSYTITYVPESDKRNICYYIDIKTIGDLLTYIEKYKMFNKLVYCDEATHYTKNERGEYYTVIELDFIGFTILIDKQRELDLFDIDFTIDYIKNKRLSIIMNDESFIITSSDKLEKTYDFIYNIYSLKEEINLFLCSYEGSKDLF